MILSIMQLPNAPMGVVLGFSQAGQRSVSWAGSANLDGTRMSRETVFDLASVTKVMSTLSLLDALGVDLDTPISQILPEVSFEASLAQLVGHRAGLLEWQPLYLTAEDPASATRLISAWGQAYPVGSYHYSDFGYLLLGQAIERICGSGANSPTPGSNLAEAFGEYVAKPLGLQHSGYLPAGSVAAESVASSNSSALANSAGYLPAGPVASSSLGQVQERQMVETGVPYRILPHLCSSADFPWRETEICGQVNDGNAYYVMGGVSGHAGLFGSVDDLLSFAENISRRWLHDYPVQLQAGWRQTKLRLRGREKNFVYHTGFTGCLVGFWPGTGRCVALCTNRLFAAEPIPTLDLLRQGEIQ